VSPSVTGAGQVQPPVDVIPEGFDPNPIGVEEAGRRTTNSAPMPCASPCPRARPTRGLRHRRRTDRMRSRYGAVARPRRCARRARVGRRSVCNGALFCGADLSREAHARAVDRVGSSFSRNGKATGVTSGSMPVTGVDAG